MFNCPEDYQLSEVVFTVFTGENVLCETVARGEWRNVTQGGDKITAKEKTPIRMFATPSPSHASSSKLQRNKTRFLQQKSRGYFFLGSWSDWKIFFF